MSSKAPRSGSSKPAPGDRKPDRDAQQPGKSSLSPGLYIVSTPIGNLRDITLRALDVLADADEVLAEDTRTANKLLSAHGLRAKVSAYHDHNGAQRRPDVLDKLAEGKVIALISDAGTPLVSDPGYKLVAEAAAASVNIVPVPGASALLAGLVIAGLPSDRFMFAGFLPPKSGARQAALSGLATVPATLVFYETGPRLAACLTDMERILGGQRQACVARELTKLFEEARRGTLEDLVQYYSEAGGPKGEIVMLVGPPEVQVTSERDLDAALLDALATQPTKEAANDVADALGLPRRQAYQRALLLKARQNEPD